ncbi:MAG: glycine oxidase ThiO [Methylococcaceae bacterium]|nr:glycine oxidase ThiO [Methylococcaceae bacterium]
MDVVIVGGGVIGLLTARELRAAGVSVTVLERQSPGRESSWAGGGILSPINPWQVPEPITRLCSWSQRVYPDLARQLQESSGIDPEWQPSGMLLRVSPQDRQAIEAWGVKHGLKVQCLDAAAAVVAEPNLWEQGEAVLLPHVAHIRNPRLLAALLRDVELSGVKVLAQHPVRYIDIADGRVRAVETEQGRFRADCYVVAAGAWSEQLASLTGLNLPVQPVRGQMLVFDGEPGWLNHIVLDQGQYLIPRRDGRILAGSTVEYAGFDKSTTADGGAQLAGFAHGLLPLLRKCSIERHWAGLRPGSPQGIPCIGRHPAVGNLYFNCGHFRNGLVMGPASARLLADLALGRPPIVAPQDYAIQAVTGCD